MQTNFFTNPYREHDKTTRWFKENVRDPLKDRWKVLMATVIFRRFNYIPTGEILSEHRLLEHWDSRVCLDVLNGREKTFTGAFMISSPNGKKKLPEICRMIDAQWGDRELYLKEIMKEGTLEHAWRTLQSEHHRGLMPYEVVTDLRHTSLLWNAQDVDTWAYFGPGGQRGMARMLGIPVRGADPCCLPQETCLEYAQELLAITRSSLPEMNKVERFEMREIEHSLCETDKYLRIASGGRGKRKFLGGLEHV